MKNVPWLIIGVLIGTIFLLKQDAQKDKRMLETMIRQQEYMIKEQARTLGSLEECRDLWEKYEEQYYGVD